MYLICRGKDGGPDQVAALSEGVSHQHRIIIYAVWFDLDYYELNSRSNLSCVILLQTFLVSQIEISMLAVSATPSPSKASLYALLVPLFGELLLFRGENV